MPTDSTSPDTSSQLKQTDVFIGGQDGTHTYRIPSVVVAPNGELLAFCEARRTTGSDTDDIDLVLKRSADGGATWGEMQVIWDDGPNTCGNPCAVIDQETGTVWLLVCHNLIEDHEAKIWEGVSKSTRTIRAHHGPRRSKSLRRQKRRTGRGMQPVRGAAFSCNTGTTKGVCLSRAITALPEDGITIPTSSTATTAAKRGNSAAVCPIIPRASVRWSSWLTVHCCSAAVTTLG